MPSEVNPETLDYLRIQLEGVVRANVESALFRYYRNLGSAIIAVLGIIGISLGWPEFKSYLKEEVGQQVQAPIKDAVEKVYDQQKAIELTILKTEVHLEEAATQESTLERKLLDNRSTMFDVKAEEKEIAEKTEQVTVDVDANVNRMQLQNRGKIFASYGAVETLEQQLSDLSNQVISINKALNQLAQALGKTNAVIDAQNVSDVVGTIQKQAKTFGSASDDDSRTTVFVQFAKSTARQQIDRLIKKLNNKEFEMPGEQRVVAAEGKHEITYFYKEDEPAVKKLKAEIESAMSDLGYQHVSIDPIPSLSSPAKPKRKVVELWLDLPNLPKKK